MFVGRGWTIMLPPRPVSFAGYRWMSKGQLDERRCAVLFVSRNIAFVLMIGLAFSATGCGSNNKGKIEGKWKLIESPAETNAKTKSGLERMAKQGVYMYLEFKPDGGLTIGIGADKPEVLEIIKAMAPNKQITWDAKYKLLSGDGIEIYDMPKEMQSQGGPFSRKDRARGIAKITGDEMALSDDEGTTKLTRMK